MRLTALAAATLLSSSIQAATVHYYFALDPSQPVLAPSLGGATPSGVADVTLDTVSGAVTVSGTFQGLTSPAIASHIHGPAPIGMSASVLVGLTIDNATSGNITGAGVLSAANIDNMLNGLTYINVHTQNNTSGEIRGQINNCLFADITTQGAGAGDPAFGVPDGSVTAADLNYYVNAWVAGDAATADITTQGAGAGDPGYGVPDGMVTAADLNFYVNAWIAGCP